MQEMYELKLKLIRGYMWNDTYLLLEYPLTTQNECIMNNQLTLIEVHKTLMKELVVTLLMKELIVATFMKKMICLVCSMIYKLQFNRKRKQRKVV